MGTSVEVGEIEEWTTAKVRFPRFAELQTEAGECEESPIFTCCGNRWSVVMYPRGYVAGDSNGGMTSIFLCNHSNDRLVARCEFILRGADGAVVHHLYGKEEGHVFSGDGGEGEDGICCMNGPPRFVERSTVMESLVEGAMVVDVRIMRIDSMSKSPFVPENAHLKNSLKLFMDKDSANVLFHVGNRNERGKRKRGEESTDFYAHGIVLKHNAPVLAEFCERGEGSGSPPVTVPINDVDADIFRHLLLHAYGGEIEEEDLKTRAKEIIDAANRYGVVSLKLRAEACFVRSTKINTENMMENLLFADAKNCALMKEAIMDFVLANGMEVIKKVSFDACPGGLMKDLLVTATRSKKRVENDDENEEDQFVMMRVDDLRRKLHEKGLDVDGSREAMIAALRESS